MLTSRADALGGEDAITLRELTTLVGVRHVAIIPDGNRRWAKAQGMPTLHGHTAGLLGVLPKLLRWMSEAGVHTQTFWGFSTENWKRQADEVEYLMEIFGDFLERHILEIADRYGARFYHLGRTDRLPPRVSRLLAHCAEHTVAHRAHVYNFALDYGGEDELNRAAQRFAKHTRGESESEPALKDFLDTGGQPHPDVDLVIRTSGEQRLSGFLPLQCAYSEFFFVDVPFPEVDEALLSSVLEEYGRRTRRFGG